MTSSSLFKKCSAHTKKKKKPQRKGTVCHKADLAKILKKETGPPTSVAMTMNILTENHIVSATKYIV